MPKNSKNKLGNTRGKARKKTLPFAAWGLCMLQGSKPMFDTCDHSESFLSAFSARSYQSASCWCRVGPPVSEQREEKACTVRPLRCVDTSI